MRPCVRAHERHAAASLANFIHGELAEAAQGATPPVLNPATGQEIARTGRQGR
jgi:acyl-CoA reductase-like NAD-dependent aldehyde dehydrogenase